MRDGLNDFFAGERHSQAAPAPAPAAVRLPPAGAPFAGDRPDVVHQAVCDTLCAVFPTLAREALLSSGKINHTTCWMRQVGMYLMSERFGFAHGVTGRLFGRDRTTACHAVQLCRIEAETRPATRAFFDFLEGEARAALDSFAATEAEWGMV